jgi:hypothetical protein
LHLLSQSSQLVGSFIEGGVAVGGALREDTVAGALLSQIEIILQLSMIYLGSEGTNCTACFKKIKQYFEY